MRTLTIVLSALAYYLQVQQIQVREVQTTPTQAIISFDAPNTTVCRVRIAYDAAFTRIVHDTNTALFSGAQDCGRTGNIVDGNRVTFVAGLRRAAKAADGKFYSRALEANTRFSYEITSGTQTVTGTFETRNPDTGKTYGEPYPFDAEAPGNYAWPTVDWADASKEYIDPLTGIQVRRMTSPGMVTPALSNVTDAVAAFDTGGSDWTAPGNVLAGDGSVAAVGASQTPLFVRAPQMCINPYVCGISPAWNLPGYSVDNIQVSVKAWCSTTNCLTNAAGQRNVDLCITVDGVTCATAWKTITAGTSSSAAAVNYPSTLTWSAFSEWLGGAVLVPPARPHLSASDGKVNTNGASVTWASGYRFPVEAWTSGSRITIGATEYEIAAVNSANSLTLTTSAGTQNDVSYSGNNIGVLIRRSSASADTLNVDQVAFRWAHSSEMEMGASGFRDACAPESVTDYQGVTGYMCWFRTPAGYPSLWFISTQGAARFLGTPEVPFNFDVSGGAVDGNNVGDCIYGFSISATNPNQVFCIVPANTSQPGVGGLIFLGTYHPEGLAGCSNPTGYRAIAGGKTCLLTWQNLTKPSQGRSILQQISTVPGYNTSLYGQPTMFGAMGRHLGFYAWQGQDGLAYSFWFDDTGTLLSSQDYHTQQPCRWCVVHSFFEAGQADQGNGGWNAVVVKDTVGGHFEVPVTAVDGSPTGAMSKTLLEGCPEDIPDEYKEKGAVGNNCVTITLAGEPCQASAGAAELANLPACPWQAGGVMVQNMAPGDEAYGISNGQQTTERFLVVKSLGANRWVLLRNYNVLHGSLLNQGSTFIDAHAAGWKLRMACAAATGSGFVWVNYTDASAPLRRDNALSPAQHGDISPLGTLMADYCGDVDRYCLPIWQDAIPERIGKPANRRKIGGRTFNNLDVWEYNVYRQYLQSHPSWRQVKATPREQAWFLDGNPWAPQAGGVYTLWNQQSTHLGGTLYRMNTVAHTPVFRKVLPTIAWAGGHLMQDISGPNSEIRDDEQDHWKYCVADKAGECVAGSAAGSVYLNVPGMTQDGACGDSFYHRRPCFTSIVYTGIGINQIGVGDQEVFNFGERFLTAHLQRYNYTWTYSNAAPIPDGKYAVISGSWLGGARNELLIIKVPPFPNTDSIDRSKFVPVHVEVGAAAGAASVRLRFGYAENGPPGSYFCTSRRDACTTGGSPYSWMSDAPAPVSCSGGCSFEIPGISGRVIYYVVDRLDSSGAVINSVTQGAVAVP